MGDPLDSGLTHEEQRNYLLNEVAHGTWVSNTAADIWRKVKDMGFTIGQSTVRNIANIIKSEIDNITRIDRLTRADQIPAYMHNEASFWYMPSNFAYSVGSTVIDPATGQPIEKWVTIQSDHRMTKDEIYAAATDMLTSDPDEREFVTSDPNIYTIVDFIHINARHRPNLYG